MDLKEYIAPLLRWWWLILASTLVAMAASFVGNLSQPETYLSKSTLLIGQAIADPNPSTGEFFLAEQLAATYAEIAKREPVREATKKALGLNWLPSYNATVAPNSQLIEISVIDINPIRAQAVANELARQLILQSPTAGSPEDAERQAFINEQLDRLQVQINGTQSEIERTQQQLGELSSARAIADAQNQINSLQLVLNSLQSTYSGLLASTQQGAINTLTVIEPANLPIRPIGPNRPASILLAGAIGFVLAAVAAYGIEFLDDTIKTTEDVTRIIKAPIIGHIPEMANESNIFTFVSKNPRSPVADAYRLLRVNLDFSSVDHPPKTIMIASTNTQEGKSTIATNLALIMAQAHRKVTLVDADFRRPSIHTALEINQFKGLSDIFRGTMTLWEAVTPIEDKLILVLPTGRIPPNPAELLGSEKMDQIINSIKEISDLVVFDAPPFIVPDASILASKVDGIVLVVRPGYTRKTAIKEIKEQLTRVGTPILGVVMNRIQRGPGYYSYSYYQARDDDGDKPREALTESKPAKNRKVKDLVKKLPGVGH